MQIASDFRLVADDLGVGWLHVPSGRRLPLVSGGAVETEESETDEFTIPEDLSTLEDSDLDAEAEGSLISRARAALDTMVEEVGESPTPADVQAVRDLSAAIQGLVTEGEQRAAAAEERRREFAEAVAAVAPEASDGGEGEDGGEETEEVPAETPAETPAEEEAPAEAVAAASRKGPLKVAARARKLTLNPSLQDIGRNQPDPELTSQAPELVLTAAADVPKFSNGQRIESLDDLADAAIARSRALGIGNGAPHFVPLANIERNFPDVFDVEVHSPIDVSNAIQDRIKNLDGHGSMEALVAAGGWCAPSEIRYDFFDISEVSGQLDLPTFGVRRGGLRWPISLSLADFFALSGAPASGLPTNATMPWEWSETDDILTATGTTPVKTCLRPPCPTFDEQRLRLFGLCVLAGNLTEDAFPELIRNFIGKVVVAHQRAINRRMLLLLAAASTATTPTVAGESAVNAWLGGLDLNAIDYREKHGMAPNAVLELVAPAWTRGVLRSDLAKKNGIERLDASDAYLMDLFNSRDLRVQWVSDWQTRGATGIANIAGTIPTNWPTTAQVAMFAPGTFGRGNGMTLDLGVVRDSVLNADNDHTAAWSEEATMLAKFGHESRLITLNTVAGGVSGAQAALTGA
jgi:hypothetical protein